MQIALTLVAHKPTDPRVSTPVLCQAHDCIDIATGGNLDHAYGNGFCYLKKGPRSPQEPFQFVKNLPINFIAGRFTARGGIV